MGVVRTVELLSFLIGACFSKNIFLCQIWTESPMIKLRRIWDQLCGTGGTGVYQGQLSVTFIN